MNDKKAPETVLTWKEKIGYAVGDTASCLYWQTFSMFLMIFYTDTFGITPAAVGTMLLVSRFIDAGTDPLMGVLADRTRSRWGKFRPWLIWGILPFAVTGVLLFVTPDFGYAGKIAYAYITYNLVMMAYTMVNVPYGALLGVISPHSEDRTKLASYRFIGAFAGNFIVQLALLRLVSVFGQGDDRVGYPLAMCVFASLAGALFFLTFITTKERVQATTAQSSVKSDLADLFQNRPWIVLSLMGLATLIYVSVRNAATLYYFKYYIGSQSAGVGFMSIGTACSMLGAVLAPYFTRMIGDKRRTFIVLTLICAGSMAALYWVKPAEVFVLIDHPWFDYEFVKSPLLYASHILMSVCNAAMMPLIWSMYADTADYGEWKFGRRATGLVFSAGTFSQKMGWAVGGGLGGWMLGWIGFVANQDQTIESLGGIRSMMSVYPAALTGIALGIALAYNLTSKQEQQIKTDLAARAAQAASAKG